MNGEEKVQKNNLHEQYIQLIIAFYQRIEQCVMVLYRVWLAIIAPPFCSCCKTLLSARTILCTVCRQNIMPIVSTSITIVPSCTMRVLAISDYKDPLRPLLLAKYWSNRAASAEVGHLMWELTPIKHFNFDYIVPVPLHWMRLAYRGFNQAHEIARVLTHYNNVQLVHLVKRVKRTPYQASLIPTKRFENVCDAFALAVCDKSLYKGKHILLVDDLMTTGSTIRMVARELVKLQPASITAIVACRVA